MLFGNNGQGLLNINLDDKTKNVGNIIKTSAFYSNAGLEDDESNTGEDSEVKIDIEIKGKKEDLEDTIVELQVNLKAASELQKQIEIDKSALDAENVNKAVIDYSLANYASLAETHNLEPLQSAGLESASETIIDGFKYIINNKLEVLKAVLRKLKDLFYALIKKAKDLWNYIRKSFHKLSNYEKRMLEKISPYPLDELVNVDNIKDSILNDFVKNLFPLALTGDKRNGYYFFSLNKATDLDRIRENFGKLSVLNVKKLIKDNILEIPNIDVLKNLSNNEKLFNHFELPKDIKVSKSDKIMPIAFKADKLLVAVLKDIEYNTNDESVAIGLDAKAETIEPAFFTIKKDTLSRFDIELGTFGDIGSLIKIASDANKDLAKEYESVSDDFEELVKVIDEHEKQLNKTNNVEGMASFVNKYNGIYLKVKTIIEASAMLNTSKLMVLETSLYHLITEIDLESKLTKLNEKK